MPEEKDRVPQVVVITAAKADLTKAVIDIQNKYSLPSYMVNLLLGAVLSDVKECAGNELLSSVIKNEEPVDYQKGAVIASKENIKND